MLRNFIGSASARNCLLAARVREGLCLAVEKVDQYLGRMDLEGRLHTSFSPSICSAAEC